MALATNTERLREGSPCTFSSRRPGRKGDPRMNRAVAARKANPNLSLVDALVKGGFVFPNMWAATTPAAAIADSEGVSLGQRKNQLSRRLRKEGGSLRRCRMVREGDFQGSCSSEGDGRGTKRPATKRITSRQKNQKKAVELSGEEEEEERVLGPAEAPKVASRVSSSTSSEDEGELDEEKFDEEASMEINFISERPLVTPPAAAAAATTNAAVVPVSVSSNCMVDGTKDRGFVEALSSSPAPIMSIPLPQSVTSSVVPPANENSCLCQSPPPAAENTNATVFGRGVETDEPITNGGVDCDMIDDETGALFLSTFREVIDAPRFSAEEELREREEMTDAERASVEATLRGGAEQVQPGRGWSGTVRSLLGRLFTDSDASEKQTVVDLVPLCIQGLLAEMRCEIEVKAKAMIRKEGKAAKASARAALEEMNDSHKLEMFLRREGMSAKNAADRYIRYWMKRREYFTDKFRLPLALNDGALSMEDVAALKTGIFQILPTPDAFGRTIILYDPCRHSIECCYTQQCRTESLIRALWYVLEAALEDPSCRKGVVILSWDKLTSLWSYNRALDEAALELERSYLPIKYTSIHVVNGMNPLLKFLKPIILGMMDRRIRSRLRIHCGSDSALIDSLRSYGISLDMLPQSIGGTAKFDFDAWLEKRRAVGT